MIERRYELTFFLPRKVAAGICNTLGHDVHGMELLTTRLIYFPCHFL